MGWVTVYIGNSAHVPTGLAGLGTEPRLRVRCGHQDNTVKTRPSDEQIGILCFVGQHIGKVAGVQE